jgi:hypothetical protein
MRFAQLIAAAFALVPTGCSALVACSGTDLEKIGTKAEAHEKFGKPIATGWENGHSFEEYTTRRKLSETHKVQYIAILDGITLGFVACRRSAIGQTLRFYYDEESKISGMRGEAVFGRPPPKEASTPPPISRAAAESIR